MNTLATWIAVVLGAQSAFAAGVLGSQYQAAGECGGYPRAPVAAAQGMCVGIVAGPDQGLKMPRLILEVAPNDFILTDMGGWVGAKGRVLRLRLSKTGEASVTQMYGSLYQPHGLARGPDGWVYVGEKGRISRFDPVKPAPAMDLVVDGLPKDGLHPLTNLIFAKDGALIVNVGAPTDRCESKAKPLVPQNPCPLTDGPQARAALWKLTFDKPGGKVVKSEVMARGLRNSMALAVDPVSGELIQGENGVDLPGEDEPVEELNIVKPGGHYGWPSCFGKNVPLPGSGLRSADCAKFEAAAMDLPPHSAPLGMLIYDGVMFPSLRGKLVIALHGYRAYGHRIVAVDRAALSQSATPKIEDVVAGWSRRAGLRPLGGPVGIAVAKDGAIWIVEDKNRTILTLRRSGPSETVVPVPQTATPRAVPPPKGWDTFATTVVKAKCTACHAEARHSDAASIWAKMVESGWVGDGALKKSKLARALSGTGPEKPMPPPLGLKSDPKGLAAFEKLLSENP